MKRTGGKLLTGLSLAMAGYVVIYLLCTASHRTLLRDGKPELAWLKREFNLSDAEFARIVQLHEAYKPKCKEMCRRIDAINADLKELQQQTNALTPKMEAKLRESAEVRVECQKAMLGHFFEVSRAMPGPSQATDKPSPPPLCLSSASM